MVTIKKAKVIKVFAGAKPKYVKIKPYECNWDLNLESKVANRIAKWVKINRYPLNWNYLDIGRGKEKDPLNIDGFKFMGKDWFSNAERNDLIEGGRKEDGHLDM